MPEPTTATRIWGCEAMADKQYFKFRTDGLISSTVSISKIYGTRFDILKNVRRSFFSDHQPADHESYEHKKQRRYHYRFLHSLGSEEDQ